MTDIEYKAELTSPLISGEVMLGIGKDSFIVKALFDVAEIRYSEVNSLKLEDYVIYVETDSGMFTFSKMGNWCQPFYDALFEHYNDAVLRSLFTKGEHLIKAEGDYRYVDGDASAMGNAPVYVYDNSVIILPPDLGARRVPLCFVTDMVRGSFQTSLKISENEYYIVAKLGYETQPFENAVETQIRKLHEETLSAVTELDPLLSAMQGSQIARIMPRGAATSIEALTKIAPSFVPALESKIADTRAAESYKIFKEICDPSQIYIGFIKNEAAETDIESNTAVIPEQALDPSEIPPELTDSIGETDTKPATDPFTIWMIAPSPDGMFAAVEFAAADSATFVYRTGGDFTSFAMRLNRALEAIDFKREVIRLGDEELRKPEYADYYMAAKRTAALQFIRANFLDRIIHSSTETWKNKLLELWNKQ